MDMAFRLYPFFLFVCVVLVTTQINPYIYTLIALLSILATIITAYIITYVRKNTLQKKSLQKTIENIIDQYELKVNNLKDIDLKTTDHKITR